ncbi:acyl transferase/acyl hydrolase/lysophospholipase, partial [Flagelloscypha sp. PMI_526]
MRQVACLSLDGGGLLALSELYILREVMLRLQWLLDLPTLPLPCDHFDVIGGSGSGGLIAILLGRLRLSVDQAIECFLDIYRTLYSQPVSKTARSDSLKSSVQKFVQLFTSNENANEAMMENNPKCKMFVCAMPSASMTGFRPECFRNYRSRKHGSYNCKIWEAARATTSHPSSFNSIRIGPFRSPEDYVGAGFGFNNPIEVVIDETKSWFPLSSHVHIVLSLGAGHPGIFGPPRPSDGWASVLENIAVDCERTANRIAQRNGNGYFRLNVSQGLQGIMFQDWADPGCIISHTKQYIASGLVDQHIDELVQALIRRHHQPIGASCLSLVDPGIMRLISCLPQVNVWDFELDHEVVVRRNYRFCIGRVLAERRVLVQIFHKLNEQRDKTLQLYMTLKHPNLLAVFRQSNDLSSDPSILFSNEIIAPAEQQLSRALEISDTTSLASQGFSLVASLA